MRALNAAALARAEAVWNAEQVHKIGRVPHRPKTPYQVLSVSSGGGDAYTLDESPGVRPHRLVVQAVGSTDLEVEFAVDKADAAFEGHRLTEKCTPCKPEVATNPIRDPDGGVLLVCTLTYTFSEEQ